MPLRRAGTVTNTELCTAPALQRTASQGLRAALRPGHEVSMTDNDDIPFNRDFPLKPGAVEEVRPGVRRVLCNNPSPFTFTGTVSYIIVRGKLAIIDPVPDTEAHASALL